MTLEDYSRDTPFHSRMHTSDVLSARSRVADFLLECLSTSGFTTL